MNRRDFGLSLLAPLAAPAADKAPNILFLLSDDHSFPYLGCYGYPDMRTPTLDKLAADGMLFHRAFQAAPQCVPARTAMLTGRSPVSARMGRFNSPLPPEIITLPDLLKKAGYFTGVARRMYHLDGPGTNPQAGYVAQVIEQEHLQTFAKRLDFVDRSGPGTTVKVVNQFLDQAPKNKPFFLWVNFNDPHHPWDKNAITPPHDPAKLKLPPHFPDLPGLRADFGIYLDEISRVDGEVKSILDILDARGLAKDTLVVFMGDNGMALPHGKGSLYDPGTHVPLIARWPGKVAPGGNTKELISGEDLTPTLLDAAGLAKAPGMSGQSFLKLLRGEPGYRPRTHVFSARLQHGSTTMTPTTKSSGWDLSRSVRSSRYKLIYNVTPWMEYQPVDSARDPGWTQMLQAHAAGKLSPALDRAYFTHPRPIYELFDLDEDPSELKNLAGNPDLAGVERDLRKALIEKCVLDYDFIPPPVLN
ncbi:MAG: sulfatase [Bryobacteraceae bacterium]|nr:sulfatase [Bryobacteraceae bacterium]